MNQKLKALFSAAFAVLIGSCATAPTSGPLPISLRELTGRSVALVEVEAEPLQKTMIEVALVNQLLKTGQFRITPAAKVRAARADASVDTTHAVSIARAAGADFALRIRARTMDVSEDAELRKEEKADPLLAEELKDRNARSTTVYRTKSMRGHVAFEMSLWNVATQELKTGFAEKIETVTEPLPTHTRLLERLSNAAFSEYFESAR